MARQIDETARLLKHNEILDCAQRLIYSTGYEEMSIQDIISQLGISKGAFYHYFDSKTALLEALLERTSDEILVILTPILEDPGLPALRKLEMFYDTSMKWKTTQKQYMLAILNIWYSDENAIVRLKMLSNFIVSFSKLLGKVFRQGINEGVFKPAYPDMAGEVVYSLMIQMSDSLGKILKRAGDTSETYAQIFDQMDLVNRTYTDAMERVLGAKPGTIHLFDTAVLAEWLPDNLIANGGVLQPGMQVIPQEERQL